MEGRLKPTAILRTAGSQQALDTFANTCLQLFGHHITPLSFVPWTAWHALELTLALLPPPKQGPPLWSLFQWTWPSGLPFKADPRCAQETSRKTVDHLRLKLLEWLMISWLPFALKNESGLGKIGKGSRGCWSLQALGYCLRLMGPFWAKD